MATLVFDIETVGEPWEHFDEITKKALTRFISDKEEDGERALLRVKDQLGFSPLTGFIVAIGMYDIERALGAVYYVGDGSGDTWVDGDFTYKERTEREMLEDFWDGARSYDTFVTFNGRAFDVPFLIHRSIAHELTPSVSLLGSRYVSRQTLPYHVDLQDEFTFYGAMQRRPSLHLLCRAYGIKSPKGEVDGYEVAKLFLEKKFRDLATYNARDVVATTTLYEKWKKHLAPASFLNTIEF